MLFHHHDIEVESKILRLLVSFKWRPIINETVMEMIQEWEMIEQTEKPHMIILSIILFFNQIRQLLHFFTLGSQPVSEKNVSINEKLIYLKIPNWSRYINTEFKHCFFL
jgi:hypothetical protein